MAKGLWRAELPYAKALLDGTTREQLLKMLTGILALGALSNKAPASLAKHYSVRLNHCGRWLSKLTQVVTRRAIRRLADHVRPVLPNRPAACRTVRLSLSPRRRSTGKRPPAPCPCAAQNGNGHVLKPSVRGTDQDRTRDTSIDWSVPCMWPARQQDLEKHRIQQLWLCKTSIKR